MAGIVVVLVIAAVGGYLALSSGSGPAYTTSTPTTAQTTAYSTTIAPSGNVTTSAKQATSTIQYNTTTTPHAVNVGNSPAYGQYLENATGFTLYTYSSDTPNSGTSACNSGCAAAWPPFYAASVPSFLNASNFATITRTGGSKQTTYKGWPLYLYIEDHQAGQINGNNVGGFKVAVK